MAETTGPVRVERHGPAVLVTLDHPPVNVLSARVLDELARALLEVERDPAARVAILTSAAEKTFAAGADISEMAPMGPKEARVHGERGQSVTTLIEDLELPVIAAVHGSCLGGGCEIALACDFVVASEDAYFGQPEIRLGVMPGWGGTWRLPHRIGTMRAREWIMTARRIPAVEALAAGLVFRVVPRPELLSSALSLGEELARQPAQALAAAKRALNRASDPGRASGLHHERALWAGLFGTPDQREGMRAFLEKRGPNFQPTRPSPSGPRSTTRSTEQPKPGGTTKRRRVSR